MGQQPACRLKTLVDVEPGALGESFIERQAGIFQRFPIPVQALARDGRLQPAVQHADAPMAGGDQMRDTLARRPGVVHHHAIQAEGRNVAIQTHDRHAGFLERADMIGVAVGDGRQQDAVDAPGSQHFQ